MVEVGDAVVAFDDEEGHCHVSYAHVHWDRMLMLLVAEDGTYGTRMDGDGRKEMLHHEEQDWVKMYCYHVALDNGNPMEMLHHDEHVDVAGVSHHLQVVQMPSGRHLEPWEVFVMVSWDHDLLAVLPVSTYHLGDYFHSLDQLQHYVVHSTRAREMYHFELLPRDC